jgi:hypothetical protein
MRAEDKIDYTCEHWRSAYCRKLESTNVLAEGCARRPVFFVYPYVFVADPNRHDVSGFTVFDVFCYNVHRR